MFVNPQLAELYSRGGQGGRSPGVMGVGGLGRREKREREAEYLKEVGAGRNGKNFATLAQYFALGKVRGGGSRYGRGPEPGVHGAGGGMFKPLCPLPPPNILGD